MTWFEESANEAAATATHIEYITFVELDFSSGYVRLHSRTWTIAWGTGSPIPQWLGVGKLGNVEPVKEDVELRPNAVNLTLSGVDPALVDTAMTEAYHGRSVTIYDGFLDTTTLTLVATPEVRFRGMMDYLSIDLGGDHQGSHHGKRTDHRCGRAEQARAPDRGGARPGHSQRSL